MVLAVILCVLCATFQDLKQLSNAAFGVILIFMPSLETSLVALIILALTGAIIAGAIWLFYEKQFLARLKKGLESPREKHNFKAVFGHNIYFTQEGKGKHVILLHGIGASHYVWRFLIPKLADLYTVTAVDLLGFGLSDKPDTFKYDLDSQCDVIIELLKDLNIKECSIIGSSMGGAIALRLAQINPQLFTKVVALSPAADPRIAFFDLTRVSFLSPVVRPLVTEKFVKQILKRIYSEKNLITDESIRIYTEPYVSHKGAIDSFVKSFSLLRDPRVFEQLSGIKNPVLLLWGQRDRIIPFRFAKKIQNKLPNSILEIHKTAGHHVQEDDPDWVLSKILPFLEGKTLS